MRKRTRIAAIVAALGLLTGGIVGAGTLAAWADDGLEFAATFEGANLAYADRVVGFSGTATTSTGDVEVWLDGEDQICTAPVAGGAWTCPTVALPVGAWNYVAIQDPGPGQIQDQVTVTVLLPTPSVTGPVGEVPEAGTIELTGGDGAADATITAVVTTPNEPGLSCSTGALVADGAWGCDIPFDAELPPGSTATVTVTQSHPDAVAPTSTTYDVSIDGGDLAVTFPSAGGEDTYDSAPNFFVVSGDTDNATDPISVSIDGAPAYCTINTPDATWSCPGTTLPPGAHTLTASQNGSADIVVGFDILLPEPGVGGAPFIFPVDADLTFNGQQMYPDAWTRVEIFDDYMGFPNATAMPPEDCGPAGGGNWGCTFPQSLTEGDYHVTFTHFLNGDPTVRGDESDSFELRIGDPPVPGDPPVLDCSFSPNGGFRSSSPHELTFMDVYRLSASGGGSGGGGAGDELGLPGYCDGDAGVTFPAGATFDFDQVADCDQACAIASLPPGDYEVYHERSDAVSVPGASYEPHSYVFRVPAAPTITVAASSGDAVLLRGTGTPGDTLRVERSSGAALCTTTVDGSGAWSCIFAKSAVGQARALDIDAASGGMSAYSAYRSIPVLATPVVPTEPEPETPPAVVAWFVEFGGDLMNLRPGDRFTLNVSGMPEGTRIEVWMHSTPRLLGSATATGAPMSLQLTVPQDIESGPHEIEVIGATPLGATHIFTSPAMVSGGTSPAAEVPEDPGDESDFAGGGPVNRADPAAPSALSDALPTLERIVANPVTIAVAGGLALALLILVALPTELLNSSLSSNTSRLGRVYGAVDGAMTKAQDWFIRVTRSRALAAAVLVVIIAIIYGFVDPGFGFDVVSLRLVLSLAIAFFVLSFVASWVSGLIVRRAWGASAVIALQPSIIVFAILGVVVARVLDFSPGFLVGIAIGLELIQASKHVSARAVFVQLAVVTGFALAAWIVYSLFTPGDDFAGMLFEDTMVALTAEGLTGAFIAVFPLKFLDGRELWEVSKRLWVLAFLLVSTAFALLVLPTAVEGTDVGDYGIWLAVFAVFGLGSLAVWLVFVRAEKRAAEAEHVDA